MTSSPTNRIGIDLGGTKIEGIVLDAQNHVTQRIRVPTPHDSYDAVIDTCCSLIRELQRSSDELLSVGIGTPGSVSRKTGLMRNCNSTALNDKPLQADLEARLGYRIRLENDANCFALSEAVLGSGKNDHTVFGVIIGTGTGGGIVIDKQLINGPNGIAGEWGHNTVPFAVRHLFGEDRPCYCGRNNCVETVLSAAGLMATWKELDLSHQQKFSGPEKLDELLASGDSSAELVIRRYSEMLAGCLATVINILDPDVIVLGGGLSNIQSLYTMLPDYLPSHVFSDFVATRVIQPEYGDASGALGAACLWG